MRTDADLQRHVLEELDWEPSVEAAKVGVTVEKGVVTLAGHVAVHGEKVAAEEVTKRVHGVRAIVNEIKVDPQPSGRRDDAELENAAMHALEWDARVPNERLRVTVRDGWITLEGAVEKRHHKRAAAQAVSHLHGIQGVTDSITVEPSGPSAEPGLSDEIQSRINAALARSAALNARSLGVEVDGHRVILTGDVHSHAEQDEAERIAWTHQGVREVENCLTITPWGSGPAEEWGY